jgi:hypothetical protein
MDGANFRAAWEAPYGITGYTENIRTSQLTYQTSGFSNGIPPDSRFGCEWQGRMWYGSNPKYPYRVYYSEAGQPQYVGPTNYLDTLGKEEITGIARGRNELVVFCLRNSYMVRQAGASDFVMEKLDSNVGCISHFGILEIHNKLWFPSEDGIWIYDGGFRYLMKEVQPLWRQDWSTAKASFLSGFALDDRINKVYMWVTRRTDRPEFENTDLSPGTVIYAGYYGEFEPSMAGSGLHPEWTLDFKNRFDSAGFYNEEGELVIGSCDGVIRKQDWEDGDDDGDTLQKELIIRTGSWLFNEPGDDKESGKQVLQVWSYIESERTAWRLYARGGDEQAWRGMLPDNELTFWKVSVAASYSTETRQLRSRDTSAADFTLVYVPKTVHYFIPQKVTGRGFVFEYRATAPIGLQYRGTGGMWAPGSTQRGIESAVNTTDLVAILEYSLDQLIWTAIPPGPTLAPVSIVSGNATEVVYYRVTLSYASGQPNYPITVQFDHQTVNGYDHTIDVTDISVPTIYQAPAYTVPSNGTYVVTISDEAGNAADGFVFNLDFSVP